MKLFHKFFLSFSLMLVLFLSFNQYVLYMMAQRNFERFVREVEKKRIEEISNRLKLGYSVSKNWDFVKENEFEWYKIIGFPPEGYWNKPKPPLFIKKNNHLPPEDFHKIHSPFEGGERFALFDGRNNFVTGVSSESHNFLKFDIIYNGEKIGWIGIKRRSGGEKPEKDIILRDLKSSFFITGVISLFFAAFSAFFLSRHLTKPLNEIVKGTLELKKRKFKTRINVKTNDELGRLAFDFNEMAESMEIFESNRTQWLSDISHELRTPISILQGEMEAILDGIRKPDKESLEALHSEIIHLKKFVNDLHDLFLSDSFSPQIELVPIDPVEILESDSRLFSALYDKKNIEMKIDYPLSKVLILGDPLKIHQVYKNLFENTLRYTDPYGRLDIMIKVEDEKMKILWEDSEPGVSEDSINHIFERLYRTDKARTRSKGGSGLGLSICRKIIINHKGKISAFSSMLGGLGIEIELPVLRE